MSILSGVFSKPDFKQIQEETISYPADVANKLFENYSFSKWLPYTSYDYDTNTYINNNETFGYIVEIVPRVLMGRQTAEFAAELLRRVPEGISLQIAMFGSKNLHAFIEGYRRIHQARTEPVILKAVESCADFFLTKTHENIAPSVKSRLKNHRNFISISSSDRELVESFSTELRNLCESNQYYPEVATPELLKPVIYEIFNGNHDLSIIPPYEQTREINRQLIERDTSVLITDTSVIADGRHWMFLSPSNIGQKGNLSDFGFKLGDNMTQSMNISQFSDTFFVVSNFSKLTKTELGNIKAKQAALRKQKFPEFFTIFWDKVSESQSIMEKIDSKEAAFVFDLVIGVSGDTKEQADSHASTIQTFWAKGNETSILLSKIKFIPHLSMLGALPFGCTPSYLKATGAYSSGFKQFADELCHYFPMEADNKGNYPNALFPSRRGQLSGWDIFKTNYNKNGLVIATSGAGKSFFLNYMSFNTYAAGGRVYIIDIGGSYRNLCDMVDGEWIEVLPDKPISFNPFSSIKSSEDLDAEFLSSFFYMLGSNKNEAISESQEKFIKSIVQEAIRELYDDYGTKLEIKNVRDFLKARYSEDSRVLDFAAHLGPFCPGGPYEKFFSGPSKVNMKKDFVVLELGAVEEQAEIRDAIIFMMIYHMSTAIYLGTEYQPTQVIIDEAHKFLGKNPRMDEFIEQAYRRFRKHNGSIVLSTQSFEDIYSPASGGLSRAGQVIIANSSFKFFLKQTDVSISALMHSQVFPFGKQEEQMMRSISNIKGEYSEFLMITPDNELIPYRVVINRYLYYIFSTDADDKKRIRKACEDYGCDVSEAIERVIEQELKDKR